ncbi:hypothetical protein GCM10010978_06590 [Compostibacillus humi]|jgi:uncharacterized integral membrane protein (TIGR02327 family)|uniref:DUF1146 domain-containing protein n=1 Tax=Compostibacillus humi TaxID=1245525 RepID=A0A8J2ZQL8_9BACI|nr:DUF1146 family protein [Compostibacillus humi]GGH71061.1 hypothetical protein GCM10010978_06590 [Compostibacillus humi]
MFQFGQWAFIGIISHLLFIYITWRAMLGMNFEAIIRKGRVTEARIFLLFIAIAIGTGVSRFFLDIVQWSGNLVYLF